MNNEIVYEVYWKQSKMSAMTVREASGGSNETFTNVVFVPTCGMSSTVQYANCTFVNCNIAGLFLDQSTNSFYANSAPEIRFMKCKFTFSSPAQMPQSLQTVTFNVMTTWHQRGDDAAKAMCESGYNFGGTTTQWGYTTGNLRFCKECEMRIDPTTLPTMVDPTCGATMIGGVSMTTGGGKASSLVSVRQVTDEDERRRLLYEIHAECAVMKAKGNNDVVQLLECDVWGNVIRESGKNFVYQVRIGGVIVKTFVVHMAHNSTLTPRVVASTNGFVVNLAGSKPNGGQNNGQPGNGGKNNNNNRHGGGGKGSNVNSIFPY